MFSLCFVLLVFFGFSLCFFMHRVAVQLYNILTYQKKKKNLIYLALSYDLRPLQSLHPYELLIPDVKSTYCLVSLNNQVLQPFHLRKSLDSKASQILT